MIQQIFNFFIGRFWYENPSTFKPSQLDQIKQTNLAAVICENGDDIQAMPENIFHQISTENPLKSCEAVPRIFLGFWSGKIHFFHIDNSMHYGLTINRRMWG